MSRLSNPRTLLGFTSLAGGWLTMLVWGGPASDWDEAVLAGLYAGGEPALAGAAAMLTALGGWVFLATAALAAALLLALRGARRPALLLLVLVATGRLLVEVQKLATDRPRPSAEPYLATFHSMSFPSGHAANSMITFLAIAILAGALLPARLRIPAILLAVALSLLIGTSRVLLGVHWPSDVLAGWAFGLAWTLGAVRLIRPERAVSP